MRTGRTIRSTRATRSALTVCATALVLAVPTLAADEVTQADLLNRLIDLGRLTTPPPDGERTAMFTSYDRASRIDETGNYVNWEANGDWGQFIRREPDGWDVMAELEGPGAITRIWSANPHGQIRFILDGAVALETPFEDLFNGQLPPFAEPLCYMNPENGGQNCYFPIGFARSCRVVIKGSRSYYQINTVSLPPGTRVETFKPELSADAREALAQVSQAFADGLSDAQLFGGRPTHPVAQQAALRRGESFGITLDGAGTIRALHVALTDRRDPREVYTLHRCVLRIFFDGRQAPHVEAPLVDFFGSGFDRRPYNSLVLGTDKWILMGGENVKENQFMYCFFPMPFAKGARIEIENRSTYNRPIGLMLYAQVENDPPARDALRFNAHFRKEDPCTVFDYPILETAGRGRIVGCTLNIDCPREVWWGEGDDKVWIDGEPFPTYFGTGSEDYLGDAWGLRPHIRPLQGVTLKNAYGKNSAYRWHIADCINFQKSARFTIENWQFGGYRDTYYATVAYWYGEPAAEDFFQPLAPADLSPPGLRIPGAVEIEGNVRGENWGNLVKQKYARGAELSGETAASISTTDPVQINIPSAQRRIVNLKLRVNPRTLFETIEVADSSGRTIGTVQYQTGSTGIYEVGVLRLDPGDNLVHVRCTRSAVLDCWVVQDAPKIHDGYEAEDLQVVSADGVTVDVQDTVMPWSGGAQLTADFSAPGRVLTLALPERQDDRLAAFVLLLTRAPDGGRFQAMLDNQPLGAAFDSYGQQPELTRFALGAARLSRSPHTLSFKAVEPDSRSGGRRLSLDAISLAPARSPYALECEGLPIVGFDKTDHVVQELYDGFSGGAHIWSRATEPGAWMEFEVPVAAKGKSKLSIVYTTSYDYGIVQTYVNGQKAGEPFDTFGKLEPGPLRELGTFDLPAGPLRLKTELVGKADNSPGYYFGVDCIILEPVVE